MSTTSTHTTSGAERRARMRLGSEPRPGTLCPVAALVVALSLSAPAAAQGEEPARVRADGVAAVIGDAESGAVVHIFLSDVEIRARLHLTGQLRGPLATGELPPSLMAATLEELVGEALIAREAEFVQHAQVDDEEVGAALAGLEALAGGHEAATRLLAALGLTRDALLLVARRRALVRIFLAANLEGGLRVDDARLAEIHASDAHPFIGQDLDSARDALRVWVRREELRAAVREWVETLRRRTPVRILARYE